MARVTVLLAASEECELELAHPAGKPMAHEADMALLLIDASLLAQACNALQALRLAQPRVPALVVAFGLPPAGLERLMACGAFDFIRDPVSPEELWVRIKRALGIVAAPCLAADDAATTSLQANALGLLLVGRSAAFLHQTRRLQLMAGCDAGVLILGETGTGKEVCARAIHYASARAAGPWVAVNCAAIPTELLEDELFGHVRGAYTHAHTARQGLVSEAEGGSLFLDEIDSLPLSAQAKLLRFLQEKEYRAVGSSNVRRADVRVIAASNRNLDRVVAHGGFRQDLYFRLNVLTLTMPPLRERREDIPALALHFFDLANRDAGRRLGGITPAALRRLLQHDWPGNVRELKHVIERAVLLCGGNSVQADDIEMDGNGQSAGIEAHESFRDAKARAVEHFERSYIERALVASDGNITHAARIAQKNRRAFFELLRKHGIDAVRFRLSLH